MKFPATKALSWVQRNAAAFGGDPKRVQIAGQSSGGSSVGFHLVWPPSYALYSSAVIQSSDMLDWKPRSVLATAGETLANAVGCKSGTNSSVLRCLQQISSTALFAAAGARSFAPCSDCFQIEDHPLVLARTGRFNQKVPIMQGNAMYEGGARRAHAAFGLPTAHVAAAAYKHAMGTLVDSAARKAQLLQLYEPLAAQIGHWFAYALANAHSSHDCGQHFLSDWFLAQSAMGTYRYLFTHVTADWPKSWENATHTAELPYLFRNASVLTWYLGYQSFNTAEQKLADSVALAWASLAANGDPNSAAPGSLLPRWARYGEGGRKGTMLLNTEPSMSAQWEVDCARYCPFWNSSFYAPSADGTQV